MLHPTSIFSFLKVIPNNWGLIKTLTEREVLGRYRGSALGLVWSFLSPLLMLAIYAFVFGSILNARWGEHGPVEKGWFALILFVGLIAFNIFSETVGRSPFLVTGNTNYVKKTKFPVQILPIVVLGSAIFHGLISIVVWYVFCLILGVKPLVTSPLMIISFLPVLFFSLGLAWIFAALGVFFRDLGQIIGLLTTAFMFLSPVFYPLSLISPRYRPIYDLNPLTISIESARNASLIGGNIFPLKYWFALIGTIGISYFGYRVFQKLRKGFADVL